MKTCYQLVGVVIALCSLAACNSEQVGYLTFQEYEDGYWGLMDHKGNVLFSDEFENPIEGVSEGVILTKDDEGLFQYYTLEKKPKFIAGGYKDAAPFCGGVAPVVSKNDYIKFINKKGEVVFELKEIKGKKVNSVFNHPCGLAIYTLADGSEGVIDSKGKVLANFQGGGHGFLGDDMLYVSNSSDDHHTRTTRIYNRKDFLKGNMEDVLCSIKSPSSEEYPVYLVEKDIYIVKRERDYTIMNKGKEISTIPRDSKVNNIYDCTNKYLLFTNEDGDKRGVMDYKGNVIIKPKYECLAFIGEETLICSSNGEDFKAINLKGDVINPHVDAHEVAFDGVLYSYQSYYDSSDYPHYNRSFGGGYACFANGDGEYCFVDDKCKPINQTTYCDVKWASPNGYVKSDFYDVNKLISELGITEYGAGGITIKNTKEDFVELDQANSNYEKDITDYMYKNELFFSKEIGYKELEYRTLFSEYIARNVVTEHGGQSFWNGDCELQALQVAIRLTGELYERGEAVFNGLNEYFATRCIKYTPGRSKPIYRFSGGQDVQITHDWRQNIIILTYAVRGFDDDYFYNGTD